MDLFDQVSEDIKTAMKAKDKVALETLRNIKKFFLEAKTANKGKMSQIYRRMIIYMHLRSAGAKKIFL